ncbi:hypothetical protein WT09_16735 [Burkholderia stagnalis]|nr:hypothetical protein WT09_16735 [Burkholderia stagnalis]
MGNQGEWVDAETGNTTRAAGAIQQSLEDGLGKVYIQSKQISRQLRAARAIYIDCCPPKVLQGHNVFGHAVLQDYVYEILDRVTRALGIDVRPEDRALWRAGTVHLTEIHLTANFSCPRNLIVPVMDAVDLGNRHGKQRILPTWVKLGLTPSGNSASHTLTLYDKLEEMAGLFPWPTTPLQRKLLKEAREGGLRAEVKLHSQGLNSMSKSLSKSLGGQIDLKNIASWSRVDVAELFFEVFRRYEVVHAVQPVPSVAQLKLLKLKELNVYTNWLLGRSLKEQLPNRGTARRYAAVIEQKTGVNIRVARWGDEVRPAVDLKDLFAPTNVRVVPGWALGTRWYSPPRSLSEANNDGGKSEE